MTGPRSHSPASHPSHSRSSGFSLIELLVTVVVIAIVVGAMMTFLLNASSSKTASTNAIEATQAASAAMEMIANDLRTAGYETDLTYPGTPQPPIAYIDSLQILLCANQDPYPDLGATPITHGPPLAYSPNGMPRPKPLDGTSWEPPVRYRTGAEIIRYTLDVNNDGVVNNADRAEPVSRDAMSTRNPNDYVLCRQVYGDSTLNAAGNNGGDLEKIALVYKPGGTVPMLFTVFLKNSTTYWNWSNGPIPQNRLADIDRIVVQVAAPSPNPDAKQRYSTTLLRTQVQLNRNIPSFLQQTYAVDGYVFWDGAPGFGNSKNHVKDLNEPGLDGVTVRLGQYNSITNASGYFMIRAPAGTYALKHTPPQSYGNFNSPDSFIVTVGPGATRSFADTAFTGGYVVSKLFEDPNNNLAWDVGEDPVPGVEVSVTGGTASAYSDVNGRARQFVKVGSFTVSIAAPDSYVVRTPNPYTGTMVANDSVIVNFALQKAASATISGHVYRDNNRNTLMDAGETGIPNVFVSVVSDAGVTTQGWAYTDAGGLYTISVPANSPPGTNTYQVTMDPPNGFFPTGSTALGPLLLTGGQVMTGKDFGVAGFQVISLSASRVLSLGTTDLQEHDWTGVNLATAHQDADLVLGADMGGTDNISIWFNQYDGTSNPLFSTVPALPTGYTRNAPQSVMAIAVDTLDSNAPKSRPDLVTATKASADGNWYVWFNQNTSGNEGFFPASYSPGQNYWTYDHGDCQAVLTLDCAGGAMPDVIVGTKSPTAGTGTIEVWSNSDAATPTFTRQEIYPAAGAIPGGTLGEVTAMKLGDMDGDGRPDLIVGTRTGNYSGELLVFRNVSKINGARFVCSYQTTLDRDAVTSVAVLDADGDGKLDVVTGSQESANTGAIQLWTNKTVGSFIDFRTRRDIQAPGIVTALCAADYGGLGRKDLAVGWRQDASGYGGGILLYFTDSGTIPATGSDPSGGGLSNFVPAIVSSNFNYGVYPSTPSPPYLADIAAGVKTGPATGALVVFIR
jgi:prepilin-type N-terminal cleavage/methylation domain-containing protein